MRRLVLLVACVAAAGAVFAATASADYGNTAVRQITISANDPGSQGGGAWLWIELSGNGTGTYAGADCGHKNGPAASDKGDVTWWTDGTTIFISGVVFNGFGGLPVPVTVPWKTGHYAGTVQSDFPTLGFLPPGFSQTTVAP